MKKRWICLLLAVCALSLVACGHKHSWSEWEIVAAADCEHEGSRRHTCACGASETEVVAATGHTFELAAQVASTPARSGYTLYACTACDAEKKENVTEPTGSKGLSYEVNADGKTCTVTGMGNCTDTELGIPAAIDGYAVTAIANYAFASQPQLTILWMSPSVKTIGGMAFASCFGLVSVTLPTTLEQIGLDAFVNCKKLVEVVNLSSLDIKSGSTEHGSVAFRAAEVTSESRIVEEGEFLFYVHPNANRLVAYVGENANVVLPKDLKGEGYQINSYAFANVAERITSVTFTAPVEIGAYAFEGCERLGKVEITDLQAWCQTNFIVPESNPVYYAKKLYLNGALLTNAALPEGTLFIQPNAFINCEGLTSVAIPQSVVGIGDNAFAGCTGLTSASYAGSAEAWGKIDLGKGNEALTSHIVK